MTTLTAQQRPGGRLVDTALKIGKIAASSVAIVGASAVGVVGLRYGVSDLMTAVAPLVPFNSGVSLHNAVRVGGELGLATSTIPVVATNIKLIKNAFKK